MKTQVYLSRDELCVAVFRYLNLEYGGSVPTFKQVQHGLGVGSCDEVIVQIDFNIPKKIGGSK